MEEYEYLLKQGRISIFSQNFISFEHAYILSWGRKEINNDDQNCNKYVSIIDFLH